MNEEVLSRISVIVLVGGFLSLFLLYSFQEPDFISRSENITENELVSFPARVNDIYSSGSGSVVLLSRVQEVTSHIDAPLPSSFLHQEVLVSGRLDGDWFTVEEIIAVVE